MDHLEIENMANEFSEKYLFDHKKTAKEAFLAAAKEYSVMFEQMETAFEACNNERKEYRDKMDFANTEVSCLRETIINLSEKETPSI
jgi:hypothetical protein